MWKASRTTCLNYFDGIVDDRSLFYFQCLLVGDNEGQVTVYELRCMPPPPEDQVRLVATCARI